MGNNQVAPQPHEVIAEQRAKLGLKDAFEATFQVRCSTCNCDDGDSQGKIQNGKLRVRCSKCKGSFFEIDQVKSTSNNNNATPPPALFWAHLNEKIIGHCHNCDDETTGEAFATCAVCKSEAIIVEECAVCWDTVDKLKDMTTLESCGHYFCNSCWKEHIETCISQVEIDKNEASGFYSIKCPGEDCTARSRDPHFMKGLISQEMYDKMKSYAVENFAQLELGAVSCPMPDCGCVMIPPKNKSGTSLTCIECKTKFCTRCKDKWHKGISCEQFITEKAKTDPTILERMKLSKQCPNPKCPMTVHKEPDSCNFMKCTYCKFQYCWICGKEWKADPTVFGTDIPLHAFDLKKPCACPKWGLPDDI